MSALSVGRELRTHPGAPNFQFQRKRLTVGSVIKKRRKRMAKKKHRKLLKKTRIQRRRAGK
ncbi:hypothetical protein HMPREF3223_00683 [Cutibacterium avidum]|nr:hypothetical protein HMPREF3223_00683 [Cutibacterium avidum]BCQ01893.1 hypothetical protein TPCV4_03370 [Cutibacterium avidum]BCQ04289.1 hypothetical protein TPCV14_03330 [Cutibacterium avidum]BDY01544.1 hypothetical protein TPCV302_09360 [Cutibacterium avidum]